MRTAWPGRFQIVHHDPTVVLDGAHNAAAAERVGGDLARTFRGAQADDDPRSAARQELRPDVPDSRAAGVRVSAAYPSTANGRASPISWRGGARRRTRRRNHGRARPFRRVCAGQWENAETIAITGSLFLVGEALGRLGFARGTKARTPTGVGVAVSGAGRCAHCSLTWAARCCTRFRPSAPCTLQVAGRHADSHDCRGDGARVSPVMDGVKRPV